MNTTVRRQSHYPRQRYNPSELLLSIAGGNCLWTNCNLVLYCCYLVVVLGFPEAIQYPVVGIANAWSVTTSLLQQEQNIVVPKKYVGNHPLIMKSSSANTYKNICRQYDTKIYQSSTENNDDSQITDIVKRPDPSILLSAQSDVIQQVGFIAIWIGLGLGTVGIVNVLSFIEQLLPDGWYALWRDYTWPIPFGLIFVAAGVSHFTMKETFCAMVPPVGTWGNLWNIPAPYSKQLQLSYEEYHVYWSGIAEITGGSLLILSFVLPNHILPVSIPSFLLFLLLLCVTPANIYMATHDIEAPGLPPIPYPNGHIGRGLLQCILLAMFWKLTFQ